MKKIIDFFRKIGLLHISKGDYINGEYDNRKNIKVKKNENINVSKGTIGLFFWIFLILYIFIILLFFVILGFSFLYFLILLFWIYFIFYIKKTILLGGFILKTGITYFVVLFIITSIIVLYNVEDSTNNSNNTISEKNILSNYNINSDNNELNGKVNLRENSKGKIVAEYNININTSLEEDKLCLNRNGCDGIYSYIYVSELLTSNDKYGNPGNVGELFYESINNSMSPVLKFTHNFSKIYNSIDEFLQADILKIHNGSKYIYQKAKTTKILDDGTVLTTDTWLIDQEKAIKLGKVARTYKLNFINIQLLN